LRAPVDRKRHRLQIHGRGAGNLDLSFFWVGAVVAESLLELADILKILRHIADKPVGADHAFKKALYQIGAFLKNSSRSGDDSFGTSIRILIRRLDQSVAALLNQLFRVPWFARNAFDFAASERRHMDRMEHAPHPFNVFFQV